MVDLREEVEAEETVDYWRSRAEASERREAGLKIEVRALKDTESSAQKRLEQDEMELASFRAPSHDVPKWAIKDPTRKHVATIFTLWSDWHIGEVVKPGEMGGVNAFNYEIAQQRVRRLVQNTVKLVKHYMPGLTYDGVVVGLAGDMVSGGIHEELRETDEFSVLASCEKTKDLLIPGLITLRDNLGPVHVLAVPGNHGRDAKKPRYKGRAEHNADIHIASSIRNEFERNKIKGITFDITEGLSVDYTIYNTTIRLVHLDEARGGNGVSGMFAPVPRYTQAQQAQAAAEQDLKELWGETDGRVPTIVAGGHWHQLVSTPGKGFLVNGALKGYDEFARGKSFRPERAQQGLWIVTPENGVTTHAPVFVDNRKEEQW